MSWFRPKTLLDKTYEIGILIKGIDGVLELLGGILLAAVPPHAFGSLAQRLTHDELSSNPHDFWATHVLHYGQHLASGHSWFAILFLLTHGLVKVVLVAALLRNKLWAYPFALGALSLFLIYQAYVLIIDPSFGMAVLTVLDVAIIWLVWREWGKVKREGFPAKKASQSTPR